MTENKSLIPTDNQLTISNLGEIFVRSGYFHDAKDAAQAVVKILAGQELGLPPIASMTGINIIKGKVSLSAVAMATVLKRHGKYDYRVRENTNDACEIEFFYDGESIGKSQFSIKDAERAGIFKANPSYKKYPRNMLFARAMSNGIRWYCPEVLGGPAYTPGELDTGIDSSSDESKVIDVPSDDLDEFVELLKQEEEAKAIADIQWQEAKTLATELASTYREEQENDGLPVPPAPLVASKILPDMQEQFSEYTINDVVQMLS